MPKITLPQPFFFEKGPRAVLLLHAYTGSSNDMRMLARALEKEEYTVYAPNFTGHGTLDPEDILAAGPSDWWEDTKEALNFLYEKGYHEVVVFGLSLGGIFATKALEESSNVLAAGTLCSPLFLNDSNTIVPTFLRYVQAVKKVAGEEADAIANSLPKIKAGVEQQLQAIADYLPPIQQKMAGIKAPFFIAQAGKDELIDAQSAYELQEALVHASVSFHWYENSSHVITVGKEHHALEKDVATFLNQLSWNEG